MPRWYQSIRLDFPHNPTMLMQCIVQSDRSTRASFCHTRSRSRSRFSLAIFWKLHRVQARRILEAVPCRLPTVLEYMRPQDPKTPQESPQGKTASFVSFARSGPRYCLACTVQTAVPGRTDRGLPIPLSLPHPMRTAAPDATGFRRGVGWLHQRLSELATSVRAESEGGVLCVAFHVNECHLHDAERAMQSNMSAPTAALSRC